MPRQKNRDPLTREQIVKRAVQILDDKGESGLSMRQLATEFRVDPMALYYHIPNKANLIQEAINAVVMECEIPTVDEDWKFSLRQLCHAYRRMAHKHPKIYALYVTSSQPVPGDFVIGEAFLSILQATKLSPKATINALMTIATYISGFALEEVTGKRPYTNYVDFDAIAQLTVDEFPAIRKFLSFAKTIDLDAEFEFGLDLLIAGIAQVEDKS